MKSPRLHRCRCQNQRSHETVPLAKDFPLTLGSKSFIPGFEEAVVGLKPGDSKDFDVTFPADYGVKDLQKRKVTFNVTAHKVAD